MANEIISYQEMCSREQMSLQRGMNFACGNGHSVILMSVRPNAPYEDEVRDDGTVLIYEGHDEPRSNEIQEPKRVDQPERTKRGSTTQNGLFFRAAQGAKSGNRPPERVRVYEKLRTGIWSYNGLFYLADAWRQESKGRLVFKFQLLATNDEEEPSRLPEQSQQVRRLIPTQIKLEVWRRDGGRCVKCQATTELHFDHLLPYAKGGSSLVAANVQLLCARHNLQKSDRIE